VKTVLAIERAVVAEDWHARGFTCGLWIDHAGRTWNGARNETEELLMVVSGKVEFEMQGNRFRPEIGEEILIPAQVEHTITNVGGRTARWLYGQKLHNGFTNEPIEIRKNLTPS